MASREVKIGYQGNTELRFNDFKRNYYEREKKYKEESKSLDTRESKRPNTRQYVHKTFKAKRNEGDSAKEDDKKIEDKVVKVFIDPAAIIYLLGTEMDYKKEKFSSQFVFKNPNETERCGCGESFKI